MDFVIMFVICKVKKMCVKPTAKLFSSKLPDNHSRYQKCPVATLINVFNGSIVLQRHRYDEIKWKSLTDVRHVFKQS
jgi:hypothetical protein